MNTSRGFISPALLLLAGAVILGGAAYYFAHSAPGASQAAVASALSSASSTPNLLISPGASNPVSGTVAVGKVTATQSVRLLSVALKANNGSLVVKRLPVQICTGSAPLARVVASVTLTKDSTTVATMYPLSNGSICQSILFASLNEHIATVGSYQIAVTVRPEYTNYKDGETLTASMTPALNWRVVDASGNTAPVQGGAQGYPQTLTTADIAVTLGTPTAVVQTANFSGGQDTATFAIPFTVAAGGSAVWVGGKGTPTFNRTASGAGSNMGVLFATTTTSTAAAISATTMVSTAMPDSHDANGNYYVAANSSRTFTVNIAAGTTNKMAPGASVELGYQLAGINYSASSTMGAKYYTANLGTFKTPDVFLHGH